MSITDELRKWFKDRMFMGNGYAELTAIADRIDAEHERLMKEQPFTIDMVPMTDESMAEHGWIRLPNDADGEYIRIGDVMDSKVDYLFDGRPFEVRALVLCEGEWEAADGRFGNRYEPNSLRHHHAPTVEDVLTEFGIDWEHESDCEDRAALLRKYAKRLTLAEGEGE